ISEQGKEESIDKFHTRLRGLAKYCEFTNIDFEIEMQIVTNGTSSRLRKKALQDPKYSLANMLIDGRKYETSSAQDVGIEEQFKTRENINATAMATPTEKKCYYCGFKYPHDNQPCPAKSAICNDCGRKGHFAKVCRTRGKSFPSIGNFEKLQTQVSQETKEKTHATVKINGQDGLFVVDTGATVDIIDSTTYAKLKEKNFPKQDKQTKTNQNNTHSTACETNPEINTSVPQSKDPKIQEIINKYSTVFKRQGKLNNQQIKLHIRDDVKPVMQRQRRIPYHVRNDVSKELKKLEEQDIVEKVANEPTPWISPIVVMPKKDGGIRLCVAMREANQAIERERHTMPTLQDFKAEVNGAKFFSKINLKRAYHRLELHPDSRFITTFSTHEGLFQYKRLNYGTNSAAEIFQNVLQQNLSDIRGVKNLVDEIIIHDEITFFGLKFTAAGTKPDPERIENMSRVPAPKTAGEREQITSTSAEDYVNYVTNCSVPKSMTLDEIKKATHNNPVVQKVKKCLKEGKWDENDPDLKPFRLCAYELTYNASAEGINGKKRGGAGRHSTGKIDGNRGTANARTKCKEINKNEKSGNTISVPDLIL
ncbi:Retrovirus-related Pol poly from transposon, partial [Paramuricea clavata]